MWLDQFRRFWDAASRLARHRARTRQARTTHPRHAADSRRRTESMIDIVREIEAVQREVGNGRIAAGEGARVRLERDLRRADRGRLGRPDEPRADRSLVPADQRRLPRRRALPVRGQRRRRDRGLRAAEPAARDVGLRRGRPAPPMSPRSRSGSTAAGEEATTLELEHTAIVPDEMWDAVRTGRGRRRLGRRLLGLSLHLRGGSVGDPDRLAAVRGGTRLLHAEQRGVGRRERGGGCRPSGRGRHGRQHDRVLRDGPRG